MAKIQIKNSFITSSAQITISSSLVRFSDQIRAKGLTGSFNASGTGTNIFVQGGNSFGTTATLGTNDSSALSFETNGSTRATIDTNGNLGIGTSSPTSKLHVYSGNASTNTFVLKVGDNTNTLNYIPYVSAGSYNFASSTGGSALFNNLASDWWVGVHDGAAVRFANKNLAIYNGANSINFYVSSSGNVGIGTYIPTNLLEIYASNTGGLGGHLLLNNNGNAIANETALIFGDGGVSARRAAISSTTEDSPYYGDLKFKTGLSAYSALTTRMIIKGNGNVGIGTTNPVSSLEIYKIPATSTTLQTMLTINTDFASASGTGFGGSIVFRGRTAGNELQNNAQITAYNEDIGDNGYALGFFTRPTVAGGLTQRLTILRGGKVGIGTTNPLGKLDVRGDLWVNYGANGTGYIQTNGVDSDLQITTATNLTTLLNTGTNASLALGSGNSERMRILSNGNVGIGITSPNAALEVNGSIHFNANLRDAWGDNIWNVAQYPYNNSTSPTYYMGFQVDTATRIFYISNKNNDGSATDPNGGIIFRTGVTPSNRMIVSYSGNVGIGTTSPTEHLSIEGSSDQSLSIYSTTTGVQGTARTFIKLFGTNTSTTKIEQVRIASAPGANASTAGQLIVSTNNSSNSLTERLRIDENGNVGIGTTGPATKLEVYGVVRVSESSSGGILQLTAGSSAIDIASTFYGGSRRPITFTMDSEKMRITANGSVGIGTSSPSYPLQVYGETMVKGEHGTTRIQLYYPNGIKEREAYLTLWGSEPGISYNCSGIGGNVNIGGQYYGRQTNSSSYALYMRFDVNYGYTEFYASTGAAGTIGGQGSRVMYVDSTGILSTSGLRTYGASSLANNTTIDPDNYQNYVIAGGIADGSGWGVTTAIGGNAGLGDSWAIGHNGSALYMAMGNGSANDSLQTYIQFDPNRNLYLVATSGNVGIGTSSPVQKLHVYGVVGNPATTGTAQNGMMRFSNTTDNAVLDIGMRGGGTGAWLQSTDKTSLSTNYPLLLNPNGGTVGIGTTSPVARLDVAGGGLSVSGWSNNNSGTSGGVEIGFDGSQGIFQVYDRVNSVYKPSFWNASYLMFYISGVERARFNTNGNLGIGTTSPDNKLTIQADATGASFADNGVGQLVIRGSTNTAKRLGLGIDTTNNIGVIQAQLYGTGQYPLVLNPAGGNVGIGTTSPAYKLHVEGTGTQRINVVTTDGASAGAGIYLQVKNAGSLVSNSTLTIDNAGNLKIFTGTSSESEKVRVQSDGNVGIGTTTVRSTLHVNGDILRDTNIPYSWGTSAPSRTFAGAYSYANGGVNGVARYLLLWPQITNVNGQNGRFLNGRLVVSRGATHAYNDTTIGDVVASAGYNSSANLYSYTPILGTQLYFYNIVYNSVTYLAISLPISDYRWELTGHFGIEETAYYSPTFVYANTSGVGTITQLTDYTNESVAIYNKGGNIGIGTTNPTGKLHIVQNNSGGVPAIRLSEDESTIQGPSANTQIRMGSNLVLNAASVMLFGTNGSEAIRILSNGNVGIGTTSPKQKLDVSGAGGKIAITNTSTTDYAELVFYEGSSVKADIWVNGSTQATYAGVNSMNIWQGSNAPIAFYTNGTNERMRIAADGNVGIGTSSPSGKLEVRTNANSNYVFTGTSTSGYTTTFTMDDTASYLGHDSGVRSLILRTNSTARLTITGDGNVGIGTTNPDQKLQVEGNIKVNGDYGIGADNSGGSIHISYCGGGQFATSSSSTAGYLKITLPQAFTNTMMQFYVDVYEYITGKTRTFCFSGYNYAATSEWYNVSAFCLTDDDTTTFTASFGHDGSKCAIYLDGGSGASNSWTYVQITVRDFHAGFSNYSYSQWASGWDVSFVLSLGTITRTRTVSRGLNTNDISGTSNYISKFTSANRLGNSLIYDNGTNIGIGTTSPTSKLHVYRGAASGNVIALQVADNTNSLNYIPYTNSGGYNYASVTGGSALFNSNGSTWWIGTHNGPAIRFTPDGTITNINSTGTITLYVSGSGNIGMGTTNVTNGRVVIYNTSGNTLSLQKSTGAAALVMGSDTTNYALIESILGGGVRFYTGNSTQTEKMRIAVDGNVGIGTSTLTTGLLTLHGTYPQLVANNPTTGSGVVIQLKDNGRDAGFIGHATTTSRLQFGSMGIANTHMTINETGNVGIGTTNPGAKLQVQGKGLIVQGITGTPYWNNNSFEIQSSGGNGVALEFHRSGNTSATIASMTGELSFYTDSGSERMRILYSSGNVGIGTTSPARKLEVYNSANSVTYVRINNQDSGASAYTGIDLQSYGGGWQVRVPASTTFVNPLQFSFNDAEKVRIQSDGNVGIGTTSPNSKLEIYSTANEPAIRLTSTATATKTFGLVVNPTWAVGSFHIYDYTLDYSRLQVASGGNVGIGVGANAPAAKLEVVGNVKATSFTGSYSGLPNGYLYARRISSNQTISSGNWANIDLIFNGNVVSSSIKYNSTTGVATLTGGKVYRITSGLSWTNNAAYNMYWSLYKNSNNAMIGPEVSSPSVTYTININSPNILEMIYAPTASIDVKIRTTSNSSVYGTSLSLSTDNSYIIIQQLA